MKNLKLNIDINLTEALLWGKAALDSFKIHPADREARWLLEFVLGNNKLITEPDSVLTENQRKKYEELISKRMEKYPLQYLIGEVEFVDATIEVTPDVLIPRPETELLVEYALEFIKDKNCDLKCADLGTGSGCIPVAVAKSLICDSEDRGQKTEDGIKEHPPNPLHGSTSSPTRGTKSRNLKNIPLTPFKGGLTQKFLWHVCDKSEKALTLAKKNAKRNGVEENISFYLGSWFDAFPKDLKFDLIVSNPPYVRSEEKLEPELAHEPSIALFSGKDGLADYREIISSLRSRLLLGGVFIGEFSPEQADELIKISKENGFVEADFLEDLTYRKRFIIIKML